MGEIPHLLRNYWGFLIAKLTPKPVGGFNMDEMKQFTTSELKKFDGKDGNPAYVAFQGRVYDVTGSRLWADGKHMGFHTAGKELTETIANAPHSQEVLDRFPQIGELTPEEPAPQGLAKRIAKLHPHPVLVHFPIAYSVLVPLLSTLYIFTGEPSFETASYYVLVIGLLAAPAGGLSGLFVWKHKYGGKENRNFTRKKAFTAALIALTVVCTVWRTLYPSVLTAMTPTSYIYLLLQLTMAISASILGHTGGKIVHS